MEKLSNTNYVDMAENVIKSMIVKDRRKSDKKDITKSKIRNLHSLVSTLYNEVSHERNDELSGEIKGKLQYLRLRFTYEAGREKSVRDFVEKADIINHIKRVTNRKELMLFCRYMEALVAYHRFYIERD